MITVQSLDKILVESAATPDFKTAVMSFAAGRSTPLISHNPGAPHAKVMRVLAKLMETEPALEVRSVEVKGFSGCSDFIGELRVNDGERTYAFTWNCKWRAEQSGWKDGFGYPDQIRAAQEFGYQCFSRFELEP